MPTKPLRWPSWAPGVDAALTGLVLLLALATASFVARNADVWLHLAAGQRLLHGDYFPGGSDPFSYSGADRTWVNHSWLADAGAYLLYGVGPGGKVLVAAKAAVVVLAFALLIAIRRPPHPLWPWAAVACLAVLAAAPYLSLRPHVFSLLFLAVTLFILFRVPRGANPWRVPVAVGVTFWLWANCDAWFILGPFALALLIVGELVQTKLLAPGEEEPEAECEPLGRLPDLATLAKALGVGVVACVVNPHHVRVWQLPFELVGAPGAEADPRLRGLLLSISDEVYYSNAGYGYNANGLAFAVLIVVGALALGFGRGRLRASHVALWLGFLALALYRVACVPYFAAVAVPLVAAQLNAYSARAELTTWGDPRSRLLWVGSTAGRVLSVLALCALCVLAYPGWLQPERANAAYARRVAWGVEPDPLLARAAGQLEKWREQGQLPPEDRGISSDLELADYAAWFAPREKVFINSHLNHHRPELPEYLKLRRGLGLIAVKDEVPEFQDVLAVMRQAGANYLAVSEGAGDPAALRARSSQATLMLYGGWREWAPWYLDGRTAVFGWHPAGAPARPEFAALRLDPGVLAFGPGVQRVPEVELKQPLAPLGWEEAFVRPAKPAPPGVAEALGWVQYKLALDARQARRQALRDWLIRPLLVTQATAGPALWVRAAASAAENRGRLHLLPGAPDAASDAAAMRAVPLLAVRAARGAVAADPDHPEPYFALAEALRDPNLPLTESERALGVATAYRQCLSRLPAPDRYRQGQFSISATEVALRLADAYLGGRATRRVSVPGPGGRAEQREVTTGFIGMPIDIPGMADFLGDMVVLKQEAGGRVVSARVPLGRFNPNDRSQVVVAGPTLLPLDAGYEAFDLAMQYARTDLATDRAEGRQAAERQFKQWEVTRKELQDALVQSHKVYDAVKGRGAKLPELVNAARVSSLAGEALRLLSEKDAELQKEYGPDLPRAALLRVALELSLGHVENAAELLRGLSGPENAGAIEQSGLAPVFNVLQYQKALQAGEYREAGAVLEAMEKQAPTVEAVLGELAKNKIDPKELVLAEFARFPPPGLGAALLPTTVFRITAMERGMRAVQARQVVAARLQEESRFFFRRGALLLLEGDIPGAKLRFQQATRKPPPGWALGESHSPEAETYLRLIERAEKRAAAP